MPIQSFTRRGFAAGAALVGAAAAFGHIHRFARAASATPEASPVAEETAPRLLVRIETLGGRPPELQLIAVPEFSLFDDGSVYRLGPQIAIYPPPALPNVTRTRISEAGIAAIVDRALAAGLDQPQEIPNPSMMDDTQTVRFLFNDGEQFVETTSWGLYWTPERPPEWEDETWEAFTALQEFASFVMNFLGELEGEIVEQEQSIEPERLRVIAFEASPDIALESGIPNLEAPPVAWPLETPLSELATPFDPGDDSALPALNCVELTGEDAAAVVEAARTGDLLSPWSSGATLYGVLLQPLLPDQTGCA